MRLPDLVNGGLVPAVVAFGMGGMLMASVKRRARPARSSLAGPVGPLVAFVPLAGGLPFMPGIPHPALGAVAALSTLLLAPGFLFRERRRLFRLAGVSAAVAAALAVAGAGDDLAVAEAIVVAAGAALVLWRLTAERGDEAAVALPILIVLSVGLALVASVVRSPLPAGMALAVGAGLAALMVQRALMRVRVRGLGPELLPALCLLAAVAADVPLTALHPAWSLPVLIGCGLAGPLARRLPWVGRLAKRRRGRAIIVTIAAAIPALGAFLLALAGNALAAA